MRCIGQTKNHLVVVKLSYLPIYCSRNIRYPLTSAMKEMRIDDIQIMWSVLEIISECTNRLKMVPLLLD